MSDFIKHEDAIKAIRNLYKDFDFDEIDAYDKARDNCDDYAIGLMDAIDAVEDLLGCKTKQIKYYDEEESVWKIGEVIVDEH